jgi:hypothetical protein
MERYNFQIRRRLISAFTVYVMLTVVSCVEPKFGADTI